MLIEKIFEADLQPLDDASFNVYRDEQGRIILDPQGPNGEEVFEAYVQQQRPGAYRVFFYYGPDRLERGKRMLVLTIVAITPHP